MRRETKTQINLKTLSCFISVAILLISLLPLFAIAQYDYQFGDDTLYSDSIMQVRKTDPSLQKTLAAAARVVSETRERWQGTFSAIFLMALQPGIVSPAFYAITPFVMIGALMLSTGMLLHTLLVNILKTDRTTWITISAWVVFLSIQLSISAREGFFWYNGAVYYTLFHCALLMLISLMPSLFSASRPFQKTALSIFGILLAFFISGGNYASAIACGELLVLALVYAVVSRRRCVSVALISMLVVYGVGMWISVSASGNALRQASVIASDYSPSGPIKAILLSLAYGFYFGLEWFDISCASLALATALAVGPFLKKTQFKFRFPLVVLIVSFGVFASQFTPSAYAASSPGPYRLRNVAYFMFLLLILFNTVYLTGWFMKTQPSMSSLRINHGFSRPVIMKRCCAIVASVLMLSFGAGLVQHGVEDLPTAIAIIELKNGTAEAHARRRLDAINGVEPSITEYKESRLLS